MVEALGDNLSLTLGSLKVAVHVTESRIGNCLNSVKVLRSRTLDVVGRRVLRIDACLD